MERGAIRGDWPQATVARALIYFRALLVRHCDPRVQARGEAIHRRALVQPSIGSITRGLDRHAAPRLAMTNLMIPWVIADCMIPIVWRRL